MPPNSVTSPQQSVLPFEAREASYDASQFLISKSNLNAWRVASAWVARKEFGLVISGPANSGKTHLAKILADKSSGDGIHVQIFDEQPTASPLELLNHLNDLESEGRRVILAGRGAPAEWAGNLTDLRTRTNAMTQAHIEEPDEALIIGVIAKLFSDRQLSVNPDVVSFAALRMPLTFDAARQFVDACDRVLLRDRVKLSKRVAKMIAQELFDQPGTGSTETKED